jgi:hypothetical protein
MHGFCGSINQPPLFPLRDEAYIGFFIQGKSFGLFKNPANG